ncbi:histidine phosphatase family protein [Carnobacterium sp. 17-4]|uniref:histidine phosphatase family protein n=1 Tax=Carnobacterium sp. (strain 17-4) TaxID=208596 RepID=UPI0002E2E2DF|nr:histidine phosphatase family protein [Carnobacterium sp. 17-4]
MQRLYFVRHGMTEYNLADRVQGGDIDSPLLPQSLEDAKKTGLCLKDIGFKHIIASPQKRVVETTRLITSQFEQDFIIQYTDDLKEFGYGSWEGAFIPHWSETSPDSFYHLRHRPDLYDPSEFNGETYPELIARGSKAIHRSIEQFPHKDLLFVGHSITWTTTLLSLIGMDLRDLRSQEPLANTSITELGYANGQFTLNAWNQTDHLV